MVADVEKFKSDSFLFCKSAVFLQNRNFRLSFRSRFFSFLPPPKVLEQKKHGEFPVGIEKFMDEMNIRASHL